MSPLTLSIFFWPICNYCNSMTLLENYKFTSVLIISIFRKISYYVCCSYSISLLCTTFVAAPKVKGLIMKIKSLTTAIEFSTLPLPPLKTLLLMLRILFFFKLKSTILLVCVTDNKYLAAFGFDSCLVRDLMTPPPGLKKVEIQKYL